MCKFKIGDKVKWNGKVIDSVYMLCSYPKTPFIVKQIEKSQYLEVKYWIDKNELKDEEYYPETILEKVNDLSYHINVINNHIKEFKK